MKIKNGIINIKILNFLRYKKSTTTEMAVMSIEVKDFVKETPIE